MRAVNLFLRDAFLSYKALVPFHGWSAFFLVKVFQPAAELIFFVMIVQYLTGQGQEDAAIGNAFRLATASGIFGMTFMFRMERAYGTMRHVLGTPGSRVGMLLGRSLFQTVDGWLSVVFGFAVVALLFGFDLTRVHAGGWLLLALLAAWSICGVGMLVGSAGLVMRDVNLVVNIVNALFLLLTGVIFPLERLPLVLQWVGQILPLTHAVEAARHLYDGAAWSSVIPLIGAEFVIGLSYYALACLVFAYLERQSIKHATYDML